ncbi:MAG: hypothetical protein ACI8ZM_000258 [Crocinitomix sp.]|jgi:hypothetical protein
MENFEFEIEFDEARERKTTAAQLKHVWKKNFTIAYVALGITALLLTLKLLQHGTLMVNDQLPIGPIFIGFFSLFLFILYFLSKKVVNDRLQKVIDVLKTKGASTTFINDTNFGIRGGFGDCTLHWNSFTTINHWKSYLLIYHAGKGTTPIAVSADEIGQENFNRVLAAVQTKISDLKNEVQ